MSASQEHTRGVEPTDPVTISGETKYKVSNSVPLVGPRVLSVGDV